MNISSGCGKLAYAIHSVRLSRERPSFDPPFRIQTSRKSPSTCGTCSTSWSRAMTARPLIDDAVSLDVTFYRPRPKNHYGSKGLRPSAPDYPTTKPDRGKTLRAVEDALTGVVWRDDAQVCDGPVRKRYGEPARV